MLIDEEKIEAMFSILEGLSLNAESLRYRYRELGDIPYLPEA